MTLALFAIAAVDIKKIRYRYIKNSIYFPHTWFDVTIYTKDGNLDETQTKIIKKKQ